MSVTIIRISGSPTPNLQRSTIAVNLRRYCPTVVFFAPMESRRAKSFETLLTLSVRLFEPDRLSEVLWEPELCFCSSLLPQPTASCCSSYHLNYKLCSKVSVEAKHQCMPYLWFLLSYLAYIESVLMLRSFEYIAMGCLDPA